MKSTNSRRRCDGQRAMGIIIFIIEEEDVYEVHVWTFAESVWRKHAFSRRAENTFVSDPSGAWELILDTRRDDALSRMSRREETTRVQTRLAKERNILTIDGTGSHYAHRTTNMRNKTALTTPVGPMKSFAVKIRDLVRDRRSSMHRGGEKRIRGEEKKIRLGERVMCWTDISAKISNSAVALSPDF